MTTAQRSSAARMLTAKGQALTLAYVGTGNSSFNVATGEATNTAPADATVKGVILPLDKFRKAQGNIVEGSQQLLLAAVDASGTTITPPQVDGTVTDANSDVWTLTEVEPLAPAGLAILYDCVIRKAA